MKLSRYDHYRPVGLGWLTEVPSHWAVYPLKRVVALGSIKRDVVPADQYVGLENVSSWTGRISAAEFAAEGLGVEFAAGDVLFGKLRPYLAKVALAELSGIASTEFLVLRGTRVEPKFLRYSMAARPFVDAVNATTYGAKMPRASWEDIGFQPQAVPPLDEQVAIVDFLDGETAKIDDLIGKQEQLIERIDEKRAADIRAALTHGVREQTSRRSSGVDWIGEVPAHWKVARLGSQAAIVRGASPRPAGDPKFFGSTFCPWITVASITGGRGKYVLPTEEFLTPEGVELSRRIPADTLLLSNSGYSLGIPRIIKFSGCINDGCLAISPHVGARANSYFYYVLHQMTGMLRERLKQGNDQPNLNTDLAKAIMVPVPPLDEMIEIASHLDARFAKYEQLRVAASELVEKQRERRAALVAAAVSGQIDLRAAVAYPRSKAVAANDNRQALRVAVGAEIVARHASAKSFGRVKLQKLLYLAEVHAGVHELSGNYVREAAGPLARDLLSDTERGMAAEGYFHTVPPNQNGEGYTYARIGNVGSHRDQFAAMLGTRAEPVRKLIDLLKGFDTLTVEAITTLYAVWNDALLDGEQPDDDRLVRGVLDEWHHEKKAKFKPADLKHWLAWMRRNGLVPSGSGSRTYSDQLFV